MTQENSYKYGKLVDSKLIDYAPDYNPERNMTGYNNRPDLMLEDGYLPVHDAEVPSAMIAPVWHWEKQGDKIQKVWKETYVSPTLDELKSEKRVMINMWRENARFIGAATYDGARFGIKEIDQNNINSMAMLASLMLQGTIPVQNQTLRDESDKDHSYGPSDIIKAGVAIGEAVNKYYAHSWALKELVNKATSKAALDAITWDSVRTKGVNA